MPRFLNPYNFVRPLPKPEPEPGPQDDPDLHLLWRCPPPPHDRYAGLSGHITCQMTAVTPVFVSDSQLIDPHPDSDPEHPEHFIYHFCQGDGKEIITGSTLRGMIRNVFEAATNSTFGVFDLSDQPLFYRMPPNEAIYLVPGRVERASDGRLRLRLLPGMEDQIDLNRKLLYAAWIPAYPNEELRQNPNPDKARHALDDFEVVEIPADCVGGSVCWAVLRKTTNSDKGFPHWQAEFLSKDRDAAKQEWERRKRNSDRVFFEQGYVCSTGLNMDRKQYERFFFDKHGRQNKYYAPLSDEVIAAYNALMADYDDRADEIRNSLTSMSSGGRELERSYHIGARVQLREGSLVYARLRPRHGGGYEATGIFPVNVPRTAYETAVKKRLPEHLHPGEDINKLCLASRVFGWVHPGSDRTIIADPHTSVAYAGRVRISHAEIDEHLRYIREEPVTLQILANPHPTTIEFYLDGAQVLPGRSKHGYDTPNAKLRGRKFYRHHPQGPAPEATGAEPSKFNRTVQGLVEAGSVFHFTIDFENLQPVELGALLWALQLNDGIFTGYHRVGYGKPLGFGSVTVSITGLVLIDARARYTSAASILEDQDNGFIDGTALIPNLVARYQDTLCRLYAGVTGAESFHRMPSIIDLQALLGDSMAEASLPIHYPRLDPAVTGNGFDWFVKNKKRTDPLQLGEATSDQGLPYRP